MTFRTQTTLDRLGIPNTTEDAIRTLAFMAIVLLISSFLICLYIDNLPTIKRIFIFLLSME